MSPLTLPRVRAVAAYAIWVGLMLLGFKVLAGTQAAMGLWWPVTALPIGAMMVSPQRFRWPIAVVFYVTAIVLSFFMGDYRTAALMFTAGSMIECFIGYGLFVKWAGIDALGGSDRGLFRFFSSVAVLSAINLVVNLCVFFALDVERALAGVVAITLARTVSTLETLPFFMPGTPARPSSKLEFALLIVAMTSLPFLMMIPASTPTLALLFVPLMMWLGLRASYIQMMALTALFTVAVTVMVVLPAGLFATMSEHMHAETYDLLIMACCYVLVILSASIPMSATVAILRRTSKSATDERNRLQRVLESATGMMIMTMDPEGRITRFSSGATQILGYTEDEVRNGMAPMVPRHEVNEMMLRNGLPVRSGFGELAARVLELNPDEPVRRVLPLIAKDGTRKILATTTTAIRDNAGNTIEFLTTADDVTERVTTENALRKALKTEQQASERLAHIDQLKTELVSTVSHELRTPIASIIGYTEVLLDNSAGQLSAEQFTMMDSIDRSSRRLMRLVDDLLTVSRIEDTTISLQVTTVSVRSLIAAVQETLAALYQREDVTLHVGPIDESLDLEGDFDSLFRVLTNLLSNAAKFSDEGGVVFLTVGSDAKQVLIKVSDSGIGIPPEDVEQLFQRFFRGHDAYEQQIPGTGLGLYIAATIVRQHGGSIDVDSTHGEGTIFTVRLPLRQDSEQDDRAATP